ncbi:tyrosine-type recombinase/integrase [Alkalibacillus haloalkaliphilus]|uniref:tyrosine-type recombinase/integrase n=1 Tax=Alkalibacillus haloalkaliphilus TaxID=94136 RepID=UPI002936B8F3|nr:tyrosine-type recombinase/integrase [Alkalibacillus haloalkaliphilus]MDV2581591.1 tyrosine-type recombinase/integrase [Alkalibacillus haloalkaliphilus]
MNNSVVKSLDIKADKWVIENNSSLGKTVSFDFSYLPNEWFKKINKEITIESIILKKPTLATLNRYNYSLRRFFEFLEKYGIEIKRYEDITHKHIQMFIFELKQQNIANSTRVITMSSLKWIINFGMIFDYDGFPENPIFDGDEYKTIRVEDILKTKYIPDNIMRQIESSLDKEENEQLKSIIEIGIDTGLRLSEVLDLEVGCITDDPMGNPVLHVVSKKNNTERFIAVSRRVKRAVRKLEELSQKGRNVIGSNNLTVYWQPNAKKYDRLYQANLRPQIRNYPIRHNIIDENGDHFHLKFHAFRHTLGTEMLNRGMSMFEIAEYLGQESLHSTDSYAKLKNPTIQKEYKELGFIGMIVEDISQQSLNNSQKLDNQTLHSAALPDGACKKPIDGKGNLCAKFNMCVICPKFITTPEHLPIHKNHLERLRADRENYKKSEYIGTENHLETIEKALETIIERLEVMEDDKQ